MALPEVLQPILTPIGTAARALGLASEECCDTLFAQRLLFDAVCLKMFVSKCLGCVMTTASSIVRR